MVALLHDIQPKILEISKKHEKTEALFFQDCITVNKGYADNLDNFQRSLKVMIDKNHLEVEKSQKNRITKSSEIGMNLKLKLEELEEKITVLKLEAQEKQNKAEQNFKRELSSIQKTIISVRKTYMDTSNEIEIEKVESIKLLSEAYDKSIKNLDLQINLLNSEHQKKLEEIKIEKDQVTIINDESYLTIKNTYSQLSISINKKINEIKKKHQQSLNQLEKSHYEKIKPIENKLNDLKKEYQEMIQKSLANYSEKFNSLNVIFDIQKESYESKKERIIKEGNESITLFNSKLSAYKETTQKEKLKRQRELREEMKALDAESAKKKKTQILNLELNSFDQELNRQIIRTDKDILNKKKETQRRLYELDIKHLREINEWRLKKTLYDYEKKQDAAKLDLNYNHNITISEQLLKLEEQHYLYLKEMQRLILNQKLLPLEYQLQIGASIQERELNILANDAHLSIVTAKYKENLIETELKKNIFDKEFNKDQQKLLYESDIKVLNTNTQLELEKEKIKRDLSLEEQELRIKLASLIFEKTKKQLEYEQDLELKSIESSKESIFIENKHQLDLVKEVALLEEQKRHFLISEVKYKHQQRVSNEKSNRLLKIYQNELELQQEQLSDLFQIIYLYYKNEKNYTNIVQELYELPSHPEIFKKAISNFILLAKEEQTYLLKSIEHYQEIDQDFYVKKIEDQTGYKYMLKHEDMMNYYDQEFLKVVEQKNLILSEIKLLEESYFKNQSDLEKCNLQINGLKSGERQKQLDQKEYSKLVKNLEHELKDYKQKLIKIEKQIDQKHQLILPLDDNLKKIELTKQKAEEKLESKKHNEAKIFYYYLNKNQDIYRDLIHLIGYLTENMISFYQALLNEMYVSEAYLLLELKKVAKHFSHFEKHYIDIQQLFLNLMHKFYMNNYREQNQLIKGFKESTLSLVNSLNYNYEISKQENLLSHKKNLKDKDRSLKLINRKYKKKIEFIQLSYNKNLKIDQDFLKQIEKDITDNGDKKTNELKLLLENQMSIANQFQSDYQVKLNQLNENFKKMLIQIEVVNQGIIKNQTDLEESLGQKNQAIILKYQANYEKSLNQLKQKNEHYEDLIYKETNHDANEKLNFEMNQKRMNKRREAELRNMLEHIKEFNKKTKSSQNKVLRKELILLRKTHYAKVRLLKLN